MNIKATYLVTNDSIEFVSYTDDNLPTEHKNETSAIKEAKKAAKTSEGEIWVWRLSHVVSMLDDVEADVESVE